ncbi:heme-binding domain-containing protein [soil metagenome]
MKYVKIAVVVLFVAFVAIQFYRPDFTNPPVVESENLFAADYMPENVKAILVRSCSDCHSNETVYPWYSYIVPSSWFLADHIEYGRSEMNFSKWNTYETKRKDHKLEELCEMVESREMPLPSYLWIHRDAKLSDEEIKTLCEWTKQEREKLKSAR